MSLVLARVRAIPSWQMTLGVALLALGFLIAAQLSSEGPRIRYTTQERTPLVQTARDLQTQQESFKSQILALRAEIGDLEATGEGGAAATQALNAQLERARIAAGLAPLRGPGLVIQLEDSTVPLPADANDRDYLVSGPDVLAVVEELWLAGAEAVAVNGERVAATTAVVDIGGSVLVNSAYIVPPYQVAAIGPADMLDRLTSSPGFVDFIRARAESFGIRVGYAERDDVEVPAYAGLVNLRHGIVQTDDAPSPSATPGATKSGGG